MSPLKGCFFSPVIVIESLLFATKERAYLGDFRLITGFSFFGVENQVQYIFNKNLRFSIKREPKTDLSH